MQTATIEISPYRSLSQVARRFPPTKGEKAVHSSTVTRWIVKGARSSSGAVIKLQARRFPGGWKVTDQAVDEFLDKLTAASLGQFATGGSEMIPASPSKQRVRELAAVDAQLLAVGI